ncbi:MAG: PEP-CTERM sorting domain-containing protein, partial [Nostoc sp.]|uniref:Npun_F0296 family exosortase-dependent surface protein n=1 Tax=Nostoc sp. TaxID=1180 RepID=UPI002FFAE135
STFKNQNTGEPYAFINFYDVGGTFDQVQFTNVGGSGFESDNHTVATGYKSITGDVVTQAVPESSSVLGVFAIGFVGAASVMTRRVKKKSVLQLS